MSVSTASHNIKGVIMYKDWTGVGKIELGNNVPISTPQISYMFPPDGGVIEFAEKGYILTTFEQDSQGNYCPRRRFVKTEDRNLIWSMLTRGK